MDLNNGEKHEYSNILINVCRFLLEKNVIPVFKMNRNPRASLILF